MAPVRAAGGAAVGGVAGRWVGAQKAETAEGKVEATLDAGTDRRIAERLAATYASLESLQSIEVTVNAGLAGLAIGFAFRDSVEKYVASILLSVRQPFSPNDHVIIEGHEGKVVRLSSRATLLLSFDGDRVRLPNTTVFKAAIVNFSRKPERRLQFVVGVGVEEDLAGAQDLAVEVLDGIEGVLADPAPFALVETLGDSNVALRVFGWVDQKKSDFGRVRSEAIRLVKNAFDDRGLEMPEPILRVRVEGSEEEPGEERAVAETTTARNIAPDDHLDREIQAERAAE